MKERPIIYLGTGRLGRFGNYAKKKQQLEILKKNTQFNGIHISPTYGRSFDYLKRINLNNFTYPTIVKIDFSDVSHPEYQLQLVQRLLKKSDYYVQIAGDLRNNSNYMTSPETFLKKLINLKKNYKILGYYLTIYYHDKLHHIQKILESEIIFGIAVHHSLIELEGDMKVIDHVKKINKNVISLRVFGESLTNYGNWFSEYCPEEKPKLLYKEQIENLESIINRNSIKSADARLIYAMNNDISDIAILTISNNSQMNDLLKIRDNKLQNILIKDLMHFNQTYTNKNRKGFGFRYPANKLYFINHSLIYLFYYCMKSKQPILFLSIIVKKPLAICKLLIKRFITYEQNI